MSSIGPKYGLVAALLTRTSTLPKRATVSRDERARSRPPCRCARRPASGAVLLADGLGDARRPPRSCARRRRPCAPCAANARAMASPMPRLPPVTIATLPSNAILAIMPASCYHREACLARRSDDPRASASTRRTRRARGSAGSGLRPARRASSGASSREGVAKRAVDEARGRRRDPGARRPAGSSTTRSTTSSCRRSGAVIFMRRRGLVGLRCRPSTGSRRSPRAR